MRNTKELKVIFGVLFYLNRLGNEDPDITNLLNYAHERIFGCNTNLLTLACVGRTKDECMGEIHQLLKEDTKYHEYIARQEALRK